MLRRLTETTLEDNLQSFDFGGGGVIKKEMSSSCARANIKTGYMRSGTLDDTAAALQAAGSRLEEVAAPKSLISSTVIAPTYSTTITNCCYRLTITLTGPSRESLPTG